MSGGSGSFLMQLDMYQMTCLLPQRSAEAVTPSGTEQSKASQNKTKGDACSKPVGELIFTFFLSA